MAKLAGLEIIKQQYQFYSAVRLGGVNPDTRADIQVQRAPDIGGLPGTYIDLAIIPASRTSDNGFVYDDTLPNDGTEYWYRYRLVGGNFTPSDWSPAVTTTAQYLSVSTPISFTAQTTSSFSVTSSLSDSAISASYALTASFGATALSSSYALSSSFARSGSFAVTASYAHSSSAGLATGIRAGTFPGTNYTMNSLSSSLVVFTSATGSQAAMLNVSATRRHSRVYVFPSGSTPDYSQSLQSLAGVSPLPTDKAYYVRAWVEGTSTRTGTFGVFWNDLDGVMKYLPLQDVANSFNVPHLFVDDSGTASVSLWGNAASNYSIITDIQESGWSSTLRSPNAFVPTGLYTLGDAAIGTAKIVVNGGQNPIATDNLTVSGGLDVTGSAFVTSTLTAATFSGPLSGSVSGSRITSNFVSGGFSGSVTPSNYLTVPTSSARRAGLLFSENPPNAVQIIWGGVSGAVTNTVGSQYSAGGLVFGSNTQQTGSGDYWEKGLAGFPQMLYRHNMSAQRHEFFGRAPSATPMQGTFTEFWGNPEFYIDVSGNVSGAQANFTGFNAVDFVSGSRVLSNLVSGSFSGFVNGTTVSGSTDSWFNALSVGNSAFRATTTNITASVSAQLNTTTFIANPTVQKAVPAFILNDTGAANDSLTNTFTSYQRGGVEKAWMGFGDATAGRLRIRNTIGDVWIDASGSNVLIATKNNVTASVPVQLTSTLRVEGDVSVSGSFVGDVRMQNIDLLDGAVIFKSSSINNLDHIWFDDGANSFNFVADNTYKNTGASGHISASIGVFGTRLLTPAVTSSVLNVGTDALRASATTLTASVPARFNNDVTFGAFGTLDVDVAPSASGQVLSYNLTSRLWQPRLIQTDFTDGNVGNTALGDGTILTYANIATPPYSGTPDPTITAEYPTLQPVYKGMVVDVSSGSLLNGQAYILEYATTIGGPYTSVGAFTSNKIVHSALDLSSTYYYRFYISGSTVSGPSGIASGSPSSASAVNAFGLVLASQIAAPYLSAISADVGTITAGKVQNAPYTSSTAGINFSGILPSYWNRYIDFTATGSQTYLLVGNGSGSPALSINADGTASFQGNVSAPFLSSSLIYNNGDYISSGAAYFGMDANSYFYPSGNMPNSYGTYIDANGVQVRFAGASTIPPTNLSLGVWWASPYATSTKTPAEGGTAVSMSKQPPQGYITYYTSLVSLTQLTSGSATYPLPTDNNVQFNYQYFVHVPVLGINYANTYFQVYAVVTNDGVTSPPQTLDFQSLPTHFSNPSCQYTSSVRSPTLTNITATSTASIAIYATAMVNADGITSGTLDVKLTPTGNYNYVADSPAFFRQGLNIHGPTIPGQTGRRSPQIFLQPNGLAGANLPDPSASLPGEIIMVSNQDAGGGNASAATGSAWLYVCIGSGSRVGDVNRKRWAKVQLN